MPTISINGNKSVVISQELREKIELMAKKESWLGRKVTCYCLDVDNFLHNWGTGTVLHDVHTGDVLVETDNKIRNMDTPHNFQRRLHLSKRKKTLDYCLRTPGINGYASLKKT